MGNTAYYRELIDRLRTDANEQERLMHVCDSTRNALEAADALDRLTVDLERREDLIRRNKNGALKPCPFCGCSVRRDFDLDFPPFERDHPRYRVRVYCPKCGCEMKFTYNPPSWTKRPKSEASRLVALRWNRRI